MRPDLAKLTTEQERSGSSAPSKKYGGKVRINHDPEHDYLDEFGGFRSSSRYRQYDYKNLTDVLSPLRGTLRKNVGRPWDKVFSEFCRVLDRRSVAGYHIWTHLLWEVETNTYLGVDGHVYSYGHRGGSPSRVSGDFYVHPVTGILCWEPVDKNRWSNYWRKDKKPLRVQLDSGWYYELMNGLWFRCRVTEKVDPIFGHKILELEKHSANRKEIQWLKTQL